MATLRQMRSLPLFQGTNRASWEKPTVGFVSDDRKVGRRRSKMSIWPLELDWLEKTKREVMIVVPDSFSSVVGHRAL